MLEGLSKRNKKGGRAFTDLRMHFESQIEPQWSDGRLEQGTKADRRAELAEVDVCGVLEDVARVEKRVHLEVSPRRHTRFCVEQHNSIPSERKAVDVDRVLGLRRNVPDAELIDGKAAIRRVAARVETLALGQAEIRLARGGIENRLTARVLLRKPRRQTEKRVAGQHHALRPRGGAIGRCAEERLHEPDLAAERAGSELGVAA